MLSEIPGGPCLVFTAYGTMLYSISNCLWFSLSADVYNAVPICQRHMEIESPVSEGDLSFYPGIHDPCYASQVTIIVGYSSFHSDVEHPSPRDPQIRQIRWNTYEHPAKTSILTQQRGPFLSSMILIWERCHQRSSSALSISPFHKDAEESNMDIVLDVLDTFIFDRVYAALLPISAEVLANKPIVDDGALLSQYNQNVGRYIDLPPSKWAALSSWSRDDIRRQTMSLFAISW